MDSNSHFRSRLYLDVDGVLNAFEHPLWSAEDIRHTRITIPQGAGRAQFHITYAQPVVDAIEAWRTEFDVELVWLTTWLEDRSIVKLARRFGTLRGGRLLPIPPRDRYGARSGEWKAVAIVEDQIESPAPFVWVDDVEVFNFGRGIWAATIGTPSLLIAPDSDRGLTVQHLLTVEEFLRRLPA